MIHGIIKSEILPSVEKKIKLSSLVLQVTTFACRGLPTQAYFGNGRKKKKN